MTRRRILEATSVCHRAQGITATSLDDVARQAGVAIGTVYRHFPNLEALVGTCGAVFLDRFAPPQPEVVPMLFEGLTTPKERLGRLIATVAKSYASAAVGFVRVKEAGAAFKATEDANRRIEASLDALVDEAIRPLELDRELRKALRALVDARVWQAFADQGLNANDIEKTLDQIAVCNVDAVGTNTAAPRKGTEA